MPQSAFLRECRANPKQARELRGEGLVGHAAHTWGGKDDTKHVIGNVTMYKPRAYPDHRSIDDARSRFCKPVFFEARKAVMSSYSSGRLNS